MMLQIACYCIMLQIHLVSPLRLRLFRHSKSLLHCSWAGLPPAQGPACTHPSVQWRHEKNNLCPPSQLGLWLQEGFVQEGCIGPAGHQSSPSQLLSLPGAPGPPPDLSSQA